MKASTLTARALAMAMLTMTVAAWAQQSPAPPPRESPRPDQLEPGVNTSATPAPDAAATNAPAAAPAANTPDRKAPTAAAAKKPAGQEKPVAQAKAGSKDGGAPKAGAGGKAQDRIELDTTEITGNRELPKVLYIVPWKRSDLGDLVGKPVNSLLDEVLAPVDRDVFKRENRYYDALKPDQSGPGAGSTPGAAGSSPTSAPAAGGKP
ncbi:MAG TPA: hypothetical protein VGM84_05435 [Steroidobacteraceae bacterium]|jgi:hypothetical protein